MKFKSIYVNGVLDNSSSFATPFNDGANYHTIGSYSGGGSSFFNGSVDEFAIWNRTLTDAEIFAVYDKGRKKLP